MCVDVFMIAWALGMGSFVLIIAETISTQLLKAPFFYVGIRVFRRNSDLPPPSSPTMSMGTVKMREGKFRFVHPGTCFFTSRMRMFKFFRVQTPFAIKGKVEWGEDGAVIEGRIPIGATLFFACWLVGWSAGTGLYDIRSALFGWFVVLLIVAISLPVEIHRMKEMVRELGCIVGH